MKKMEEVTKEQFTEELKAAISLARKRASTDDEKSQAHFYSDRSIVCNMSPFDDLPFRRRKRKGVKFLRHTMDCPCNRVSPGAEAICYAKVKVNGTLHFYITQHLVGECPWKE